MRRPRYINADDLCTCGHRSEEHVNCASGDGSRCTVCVCDRFDWDIEASMREIDNHATDAPCGHFGCGPHLCGVAMVDEIIAEEREGRPLCKKEVRS